MQGIAPEVVSIAEACLGGLRGRSALVVGPQEERHPYVELLQKAGMKYVYQEDTPHNVPSVLPHVQLLIHAPALDEREVPTISAAAIACGCTGRRTPLLIFDLADSPSVEEMAGLLPAVCLYTPEDLRHILPAKKVKIHL
jgi:glutamyl-tRNA reductase